MFNVKSFLESLKTQNLNEEKNKKWRKEIFISICDICTQLKGAIVDINCDVLMLTRNKDVLFKLSLDENNLTFIGRAGDVATFEEEPQQEELRVFLLTLLSKLKVTYD